VLSTDQLANREAGYRAVLRLA